MNAKDVIRTALDSSSHVASKYIEDLKDEDLLVRPLVGMNHLAWQLGHLIASERMMVEGVKPGSCPPLPPKFAEAHDREAAASDDPKQFLSKAEYLKIAEAQRAATKAVLDGLSEADLDLPGPEPMRSFAPTVGSVMLMAGNHVMMHVGQFVAVRRKLGKPVVI